ncbi:Protein of unknown function [Yoonia tamlensis]|uniref:DUF2867 domain-containing protein n=1 Tax=Yoonia tamlensis TaxID=390270 RepID=A0A1I6G0I8_9RHOB|nr:DUF2867 domain-containing protein [Yoonia tamlensis]SFR35682.1 Protein of unknown function [Yoonia tamlensis]
MPKIIKTALPQTSTLWAQVQPGDFIDGYAVQSHLSPQQAAQTGFALPGWANALMRLRNLIMKPFGLKTESSATGDQAIFPVHVDTMDELVIGTDDSHLNFRIAIIRQNGMIHMATWVHRNNLLGRVYLAVVMPFHILLTRGAMRRIASAAPSP